MKTATETLKKRKIASVLNKFSGNIAGKNGEILSLRSKIIDLEQRVSEREVYTSKDCIIIKKMPHFDQATSFTGAGMSLFRKLFGTCDQCV